jgi:hypothetical protein
MIMGTVISDTQDDLFNIKSNHYKIRIMLNPSDAMFNENMREEYGRA